MDKSLESAYRQSQQQIAQLERELAEFRASSLELEHELELELEEKEKVELELLNSVKSLNDDVAQWKVCPCALQPSSSTQSLITEQVSRAAKGVLCQPGVPTKADLVVTGSTPLCKYTTTRNRNGQ